MDIKSWGVYSLNRKSARRMGKIWKIVEQRNGCVLMCYSRLFLGLCFDNFGVFMVVEGISGIDDELCMFEDMVPVEGMVGG